MRLDVPFNGKHVSFRLYEGDSAKKFAAASIRYGHRDTCPLCVKPIGNGEWGVVLSISNQAGIPNRVLHLECFRQDTPENIAQQLHDSFEKAKSLKLLLAPWFPEFQDY